MIEVILKRGWDDDRATLGMLTIKGVRHDPFFTLENPKRKGVIDSRIPAGFYDCVPFSSPAHQNVYEVKDVPERTGILFHVGNYERDTFGCILLGNSVGTYAREPSVMDSKAAIKRFRELIGENVFELTIV